MDLFLGSCIAFGSFINFIYLLLIFDNYDSFTYNLQDYFLQLQTTCLVIQNDEMQLHEVAAIEPEGIVISPGPETPSRAGILPELIRHFHHRIPMLGICLGHQGIGEFFGAELVHADKPMHGKTSVITHTGHPVFEQVSNPFKAMRYHSLILKNLDRTPLDIIAQSDDGAPMAIAHPQFKICGIQFHPESILTPDGRMMLQNWLRWSGLK